MTTSSTTTIARLDASELQKLDRRLTRSLTARKTKSQRVTAKGYRATARSYLNGGKKIIISHENISGSNSVKGTPSPSSLKRPGDETRANQKRVPSLSSLKRVGNEIMANAKSGVKIASQAESHPLIPIYEAANIHIPPELKVDYEKLNYEFYLVEVTFSVLLPEEQFPLSAEFELTLIDDSTDPIRRTRPIRLFPGRKDIQFFKADLEGSFGIDTKLNFSTPQFSVLPNPYFKGTAQGSANVDIKAGLVFGPLTYSFRKAALEVIGESDQHIVWRYNLKSQLNGANEFKSIMVLKIAKEVRNVSIDATLHVVPAKHSWLNFKNILPALPARATLPVELVV